ncbi:GNAT family N-acetyltransferase [Streptacidiphilus sp. PAMC 29251]
MLQGTTIGLRARHQTDVPVLHAELYNDVAMRAQASTRPWYPIPPGSAASPYALSEPSDNAACFSVVTLDTDELAGEAVLWGIDTHNRTAHLGLSLRPGFRNRGFGADVVSVLCDYGFTIRGLQRLQIETLADNIAMKHAALRNGFTLEGTLRRAAWVNGAFADEVVFGVLATEWHREER